jgi:hypothetical protein
VRTLSLPLLLALALSSCDRVGEITIVPEFDLAFSFESGLGTWAANGVDLEDPPVDWRIETSTAEASEGARSAALFLDNLNSSGKIWIERGFDVEPDRAYDIDISFDFGSADTGDVNLWRILAGAHTAPPERGAELTVRESTGNDAGSGTGVRWSEKRYTARATADGEGRLYVVIGVWGTWPAARSYYIDNVRLLFTRVSP